MAKSIPPKPNVIIPPIEDGETVTGNDQTPAKQKRVRKEGSTPAGKKVCPFCQGLIWVRATECEHCHKTIPPKDPNAKPAKKKAEAPTAKIDETALLKVLVARGFKISRLRDELTGEIVKEEFDPQIKNLELKYSTIPANAEDGVYVIQTSPQPQFAMNLDTLIRVGKFKV